MGVFIQGMDRMACLSRAWTGWHVHPGHGQDGMFIQGMDRMVIILEALYLTKAASV